MTISAGGVYAQQPSPFKVSRYSGKDEVMPEEIVLIQPVAVERDKDGWWYHPDIPSFGDGEDPAPYIAWTKEQGLELKGWHSGDETYDLPDEDAACIAWNPEAPSPEWFLMGIFDTEDGPYAQWARRPPGLQREVEAVAAGKDFCGACGDGCGSCQVAEESPLVTP